ncbi:MAG: glycine--tRNA ligase subunit alpha, partial [Terriglobales bacterium]
YDLCLKCSNLFNILDARGAISVTERVGVIARVRQLAVGVAKAWVTQQQAVSRQLSAVSENTPVQAAEPLKVSAKHVAAFQTNQEVTEKH